MSRSGAPGNKNGNSVMIAMMTDAPYLLNMHTATAPERTLFGARLKALLSSLQPPRTQAWLATKAGIERSTVSRLIKGERNPTMATLMCLAPVLGVEIEEFIRGTDAETRLRGEIHDWVPRADLEAVIAKLAEYEGLRNDLEARIKQHGEELATERERLSKERKLRIQTQSELSHLSAKLEHAENDVEQERQHRRRLERELARHRWALARAAAQVNSLRGQLRELAERVESTGNSARVGAILAGVAAIAGVATATSFFHTKDDDTKE